MIRFRYDRCSYDMTPVISDKGIEDYTRALLSDYRPALLSGIPTAINAFHFVESYLGARIEYQDIYYEEGQQPILGMTCFAETRVKVFDREHMCTKYITVPPNTIIIDNSVMEPGKEALANFTVLHEGGHFCMHRDVFEDGMRRSDPPEFCSRKKTGSARKRLRTQEDFREHQADVFAAAVALPADTLVPCATQMIRCMGFPDGVFVTGHKYDRRKKPELDRLIGNLADTCGVSRSAVKIRLQRLGLLQDRLEYGRDILIVL